MTLVLLGVFGCVPAFDNNFSVSLGDAGSPAVPWITPLLDAEVSGWRQTGFRVGVSFPRSSGQLLLVADHAA